MAPHFLVCIETGKKTKINLTADEPWTNDEILDAAAEKLLHREPEYKHAHICISADKMRAEIWYSAGDLTEHTSEYRTFKLIPA